jgi:hypothetical protein
MSVLFFGVFRRQWVKGHDKEGHDDEKDSWQFVKHRGQAVSSAR